VDLDANLALESARLAALHQLDLTASVLMATAASTGAQLWTTDRRLAHLPEVRFRETGAAG
jgi:predicted nucleic acid-binding protein